MVHPEQYFWQLLAIFVAVNSILVLMVVLRYWWFRRPSIRPSTLTKRLLKIQQFPKKHRQLLRILLSTRTVRVESLWHSLSEDEIESIRKTAIPVKLRNIAQRGRKWHRVRAILLLGLLQDKQAIGLLRKAALDKDEDIAFAATSAIGRFSDESNARFLISLLTERYQLNGSRIASVIEGIHFDISSLLLEALRVGDKRSRFWQPPF